MNNIQRYKQEFYEDGKAMHIEYIFDNDGKIEKINEFIKDGTLEKTYKYKNEVIVEETLFDKDGKPELIKKFDNKGNKYKEVKQNGPIKSISVFINNKLMNKKSYFSDNILNEEIYNNYGNLTKYNAYYENGTIKSTTTYFNDKKEVLSYSGAPSYIAYNDAGKILTKEWHQNGKIFKRDIILDDIISVEEFNYNGKRISKTIFENDNGNHGKLKKLYKFYKNEITIKEFGDNGKVVKYTSRHKNTKQVINYYKNGNIRTIEKFKINGDKITHFSEDYIPSSISFRENGDKIGETYNYEDGKVKKIIWFENYSPLYSQEFYKNGKLRISNIYKNGKIEEVDEFREDGSFISISKYKNNIITEKTLFDEQGKYIRQIIKFDEFGNEITSKNLKQTLPKKDLSKAGYRIAANQISKGTRKAIVSLLKSKNIENSKLKYIEETLDSEIGLVVLNMIIGYSLEYSKYNENDICKNIAREFRVQGITRTADAMINELIKYISPVIKKSIDDIPKFRIEDKNKKEDFFVDETLNQEEALCN